MHLRGRGLLVLTGCGHAGLVNTVRGAVQLTRVPRVHALLGGFHLCGASPRRIRATIRDLRRFTPRWIVPSHCSGLEFEAALAEAFSGPMPDRLGGERVFLDRAMSDHRLRAFHAGGRMSDSICMPSESVLSVV